jgi:hypothetical protein
MLVAIAEAVVLEMTGVIGGKQQQQQVKEAV